MRKKEIDYNMEQKILKLYSEGVKQKDICDIVKKSRRSICYVLKKYRVPEEKINYNINLKNNNLFDIISLRLLYYCDDFELISDMLQEKKYINTKKPIYIKNRLFKILKDEKIKKIISIIKKSGLDVQVQ